MYRVILSGTVKEADAYARDQGFPRGKYRIASRAAAIRGIRVTEIHELPSFADRVDKHSVLAALRYVRKAEWFYIEQWPLPEEEADQVEVFSEQGPEPIATYPVLDQPLLDDEEERLVEAAVDEPTHPDSTQHANLERIKPVRRQGPVRGPKRPVTVGGTEGF